MAVLARSTLANSVDNRGARERGRPRAVSVEHITGQRREDGWMLRVFALPQELWILPYRGLRQPSRRWQPPLRRNLCWVKSKRCLERW